MESSWACACSRAWFTSSVMGCLLVDAKVVVELVWVDGLALVCSVVNPFVQALKMGARDALFARLECECLGALLQGFQCAQKFIALVGNRFLFADIAAQFIGIADAIGQCAAKMVQFAQLGFEV